MPFVSFLALVGNTIAISSDSDMPLLASTLAIIKPVTENSPAAQSLFDVCQKFYCIAEILVSGKPNAIPKTSIQANAVATSFENSNAGFDLSGPMDISDYKYPMSQQDWDDVMREFETGLGDVNAGEMAMFIEPYM